MRKHFSIALLSVALVMSLAVLIVPVYALGQSYQEPRLEGVSYYEMAEWQWRYGGGFHGVGFPGPVYCGDSHIVPVVPQEMQPPPKVKKRAVRKSTKQPATH